MNSCGVGGHSSNNWFVWFTKSLASLSLSVVQSTHDATEPSVLILDIPALLSSFDLFCWERDPSRPEVELRW